jgi:hypothetical protein
MYDTTYIVFWFCDKFDFDLKGDEIRDNDHKSVMKMRRKCMCFKLLFQTALFFN